MHAVLLGCCNHFLSRCIVCDQLTHLFIDLHDLKYTAVPLVDDRYLPLQHGLFDRDAIVLNEMPKSLMIESKKDCRKIRVVYEDMNYLGIWHWPKMEVNYVCIEPWSSLPSRKGIIEDLETQPNLLRLESGCEYQNAWSITIEK